MSTNTLQVRNTFSKTERLCDKKSIEHLFENGKSFYTHPVRVIYAFTPENGPAAIKILISVPKRNIKTAIGRNRIKRLIREAYRTQKQILVDQCIENGLHLNIAFIYSVKQLSKYEELKGIIFVILQRLREISINSQNNSEE